MNRGLGLVPGEGERHPRKMCTSCTNASAVADPLSLIGLRARDRPGLPDAAMQDLFRTGRLGPDLALGRRGNHTR